MCIAASLCQERKSALKSNFLFMYTLRRMLACEHIEHSTRVLLSFNLFGCPVSLADSDVNASCSTSRVRRSSLHTTFYTLWPRFLPAVRYLWSKGASQS
jgi:hypothetical protein